MKQEKWKLAFWWLHPSSTTLVSKSLSHMTLPFSFLFFLSNQNCHFSRPQSWKFGFSGMERYLAPTHSPYHSTTSAQEKFLPAWSRLPSEGKQRSWTFSDCNRGGNSKIPQEQPSESAYTHVDCGKKWPQLQLVLDSKQRSGRRDPNHANCVSKIQQVARSDNKEVSQILARTTPVSPLSLLTHGCTHAKIISNRTKVIEGCQLPHGNHTLLLHAPGPHVGTCLWSDRIRSL